MQQVTMKRVSEGKLYGNTAAFNHLELAAVSLDEAVKFELERKLAELDRYITDHQSTRE